MRNVRSWLKRLREIIALIVYTPFLLALVLVLYLVAAPSGKVAMRKLRQEWKPTR